MVAGENQALANRNIDLEARLQKLERVGGSQCGGGGHLVESETCNRRPTLIIGGWDPDQAGAETLQNAKDVIRELQVDVDTQNGFVPGLRMGYAILPFQPRAGESPDEARHRVQSCVGASSRWDAEPPLDSHQPKPRGPDKRKRAQLAAKTKRLILELGGNWGQLEVEYATGTAWYAGGRFCSSSLPKPSDSVQDAGPRWIDLAKIARNLGMGEQPVKEVWQPVTAALR